MTVEQVKISFLWIKVAGFLIAGMLGIISVLIVQDRSRTENMMLKHDRQIEAIRKIFLVTNGIDINVEINQTELKRLIKEYNESDPSTRGIDKKNTILVKAIK